MRGLIVVVFVMLASRAVAQTTMITVSSPPCINPAPPSAALPPATPSVAAGTLAARNRDFALALANFKPLADQGDADAERALGQLLMQNCTGLQDKSAAVAWLTKAASRGNVSARNQLGFANLHGLGVTQDDAKAFAFFNQTAAVGDAVGEAELGYLYDTGRGVPQDKYQGLQWTVKAAEQGNAAALSRIAAAYIHGEILERDTDRAAYFLALTNERSNAAERAGMMGLAQEIRQTLSADHLAWMAKRAQGWTPGAGSLRDVLSDAEDFRKRKK
ncbi:MAG TPA: tetratricopeptide repeat protein [Rhizomicrobium sp.]|nr:tetratricopeptide repeat protein [Rhizomicrobium sp.]